METLHEYNDNTQKHSMNSLPCFARYVLESFSKEYESFTDSNFLEYMEQKILVRSEPTFFKLLNLERRLIGEGSHRRLSSSFKISVQPDLIGDFSSQICELVIIERLPSGVFADPFELQHLRDRGVFKDASVFGDTNLELPSFLSNQSVVEVHLDAALNNSAGQETVLEFKIEIPLHARYSPLEDSGYSKVRFGAPDLFLYCKLHGKSPAQSCSLLPITSSGSLELDDIVWTIPAGIKAHSRMVSVVTFMSALLSATFIIIASLQSSPMKHNGRSKQS
uniref:Phosphatidylinositol-glycan biosynthesis class X protein n=1 Tax=Chenopodium quinoa TaxID=63459 RepID=A0A803MRS5_CHEQI